MCGQGGAACPQAADVRACRPQRVEDNAFHLPISSPAMRHSTLSSHRTRMGRVTRHLAGHLDDPIDGAFMARLAGLSARQLGRVFTRTVGESPRAYVRRLRLERAAVRLRTTPARILTVAVEAGFESHEAFTRAFRDRFGNTPQAYRRLGQANAQPRSRAVLWQLAVGGALRRHVEGHGPDTGEYARRSDARKGTR
jgi:AraC-like DNA-binding protein